jgi:D-alanine-D-alanine ligase
VTRRVTILTGGSTPERDVALAGAAQVVTALRQKGHEVQVVDTTRGLLTPEEESVALVSAVGGAPPSIQELAALATKELGPRLVDEPAIREADVVFLVLHGRQGEGGEIQTILELAAVPYTGSGPLGSAIAMDKDVSKRLFQCEGVPTAPWVMWPATDAEVDALGWPVVVKPSKVGSTVGLTVVHSPDGIEAAVQEALEFDDEVLIERYVEGRELTVGVLGNRALAVGEIIPKHDIFDYECKYTPGMSQEIFPAEIPAELADALRTLALRVHLALKLRDYSRVDFRVSPSGAAWCLEANTLPGLTGTSLFPQSAGAAGIDFGDLCDTICQTAIDRTNARNKAGA